VLIEETTIRITATFNEERTHRYMLRRVWDESKPSAVILMSNASTADIIRGDLTSMLVQNNLADLGYGAVTCVNLFSLMCQKLDLSGNIGDLTDDENTRQILEAVKESDITIIGIGSVARTYKRVALYQNRLFNQLRQYQSKIHAISAPDGTEGLHPLSAKLREVGSWTLVPFQLLELPEPSLSAKTNADAGKKDAKTRKTKKGK